MKKVFVVYKTDDWQSIGSRVIIGIATTKEIAVKICIAGAKSEGVALSKDLIDFLIQNNQTQNYLGEGEFSFYEMDVNQFIN